MLKIAIHTLGCKVNQCDADALMSALTERGYDAFNTREFDCGADVFIINTCTVTHIADKKSRQCLRRAKKYNPGAYIIMCGCLGKNSQFIRLVSLTGSNDTDFIFDAREPEVLFTKLREIEAAKPRNTQYVPRKNKTKTRSFIKIQDGCDRFCSYCIVPYVRGPVKSRPLTEIAAEAEALVAVGTLEIVLTGIQVAAYGQDMGSGSLAKVITTVAGINGLNRLRLSSIDPWAVDDAFLKAVADAPALCPHFHLSLQSGCDATLEKMNRRYTAADYAAAARALREISPETALTTDIIVGFPGETDADFNESLSFTREMRFSQIHVFEFSPRRGTAAADFPEVPPEVKRARGKIMRENAELLRRNYLQSQIGKTHEVLFESHNTGFSRNYCKVTAAGKHKSIQKVKITAHTENQLKGEIIYGNPKN